MLAPGEVGCLRAGVFSASLTKITTPGVTLRSYPGERATIRGRLWIDARGVEIASLVLDSAGVGVDSTSPTVTAPDVIFRGNEVTNRHEGGICFGLGSDKDDGMAVRTLIEDNRIHDCGRLPPSNHDHGIYAVYSRDAVIRNNLVYANSDRGIQLYPDADGTRISGNVIVGNGEGVIISGNGTDTSDDNLITGNVIIRSQVRWNVESHWPDGLVGSGNAVRGNCVFADRAGYEADGGIAAPNVGFRADGNLVAEPADLPPPGGFAVPDASACRELIPAGSPARDR